MATDSISARIARRNDEMRPVSVERAVAPYAEGSCLDFVRRDARPLRGIRRGRRTGLAARSRRRVADGRVRDAPSRHDERAPRASAPRLGGRTQEIQRLIGRSIRAMLDDFRFGEYTIKLDCDVLVADGGTRTGVDHRRLCRGHRRVRLACF